MKIDTYILDTFTSERFRGNPTAVCVSKNQLDSGLMHNIAMELGFPVTAFCTLAASSEPIQIRYFTITGEIPACGHATLGAAYVLLEPHSDRVSFVTGEGLKLQAKADEKGIFLTYPKYEARPYDVTQEFFDSLGLEKQSATFCAELETVFIEVEPVVLRSLAPDFKRLIASNSDCKEVVVTSISDDSRYDFLLRSFCPWIGIDEDPVTGSVHSVLTPMWASKLGKSGLTAYQASKRGGVVRVRDNKDSVEIGGDCVFVLSGEMPV